MELNEIQRVILHNQYEILKCLDNDNSSEYEKCLKIVDEGYEHDYDYLTHGFEHTPKGVSQEVYDILQMFRSMLSSYYNLDEKSEFNQENCMFKGFDGNEESQHYFYAKWLLKDLSLYEEFSECDVNSHYNMLDTYREMIKRFNKVIDKKGMNKYTQSLSINDLNYIIEK